MKRLFWDIETSPNVVLSWRVGYKIRIDCDNILKERAIICIGYKWQHEKTPHCLEWNKGDDKEMILRFLEIAQDADELVAQNGDSFDLPWFKTRCLFHGVKSLPKFRTADTLQWAKRNLYFNSNKLDYMASYLGIGHKIHTDFKLWKDIVLNNCPNAMKKMTTYCMQDVVLLQKVWERLNMVVSPKIHNAVLLGGEKWQCPRCVSDSVQSRGKSVTAAGTIQHRMQCLKCGGWYMINGATHKAYQQFKKENEQTA